MTIDDVNIIKYQYLMSLLHKNKKKINAFITDNIETSCEDDDDDDDSE